MAAMIDRMKLLLFAIAVSASAQTMIESGILTGAMGTAAGKAGQTTAKALNSALGNTAKVLGTASASGSSAPSASAASTANSRTAVVASSTKDEPALPPVQLAEVRKVKTGMSREEVITLLGKPSQKMTIPDGEHITERYRYTGDKGWARIALEDGKVTEVETGEKN
jgi:major membrane immunogen (membrane-anchored lipoprotein)